MNFNSWVKHVAQKTDDPEGDLVRDFEVCADLLPEGYKEVRRYLISQRACPEALSAFYGLYQRYKIFLKTA